MRVNTHRKQAPRRKSFGNTLIGLFVGLVVGVLLTSGVVYYIKTKNESPPFSEQFKAAKQQPPTATVAPVSVPSTTPMALPGKPGDPIPQPADDKPRFDFYKILPGNAEEGHDAKTAAKQPEAKSGNEKETLLADALYLQTGSFQNAGDADSQKARLAMLGAEALIQQVMLQDKVWYRVRLGPFRKMDEVNNMRAELARQGIEANVVK